MKQDSMKVLFFIRKSRLKKNGEAPVFLRIRSACEKIFLYLCARKRQMFFLLQSTRITLQRFLEAVLNFFKKFFLA